MSIIMTQKILRPRDKFDHYPTDPKLVSAALDRLIERVSEDEGRFKPKMILDPGSGNGVWGTVCQEKFERPFITGVELQDIANPGCYSEYYKQTPFETIEPEPRYDLVVGNPPYILAEDFIRLGWQWLKDGGYMMFLLRLNFLEGKDRGRRLFKEIKPWCVDVLMQRPSFTGNGKTDATAYMMCYWKKTDEEHYPAMYWLDWR